jgi:O-antigen/teichoic acid export membrane protein
MVFYLKIFIKYIKENKGLSRIVFNINWLAIESFILNLAGFFVAIFVARYLGPEKYGTLNFAFAFVGLFSIFSTLGLNNLIINNLLKNKNKEGDYLGSVFFIKFVGSLILIFISSLIFFIINPEDKLILSLIVIISSGYIFKSFDVVEFWFRSRLLSKYSVFSRLISFSIVSLFKVFLIIFQAPLIAFAFAFFIDCFLLALLLSFYYYQKKNRFFSKWRVDKTIIIKTLRDCWPLAVSGIASMIYMRIDKVMIGSIIGQEDLGIYSVATKISEAWYIVPLIVTSSAFPSLIKMRKKNSSIYFKRIQVLYDYFFWFTVLFSFLSLFLSSFIINLLFGPDYAKASSVLSIHIWAGVFVFMGFVNEKYLIMENLTKIIFINTILGGLLNIILNLYFIPIIGIKGAALSTLLSYIFLNSVFLLFFKKSRVLLLFQLRSFNLFRIFKQIKLFLNILIKQNGR